MNNLPAPVYINHIATATPHHDVHSSFILFAQSQVNDTRKAKLLTRMIERCGIAHRYSVLEPDDIDTGSIDRARFYRKGQFPSSGERMAFYEQHALALVIQTLDQAVFRSSLPQITHLILTSCTGFYAPGIDLELMKHYQMGPTVERCIIGFMGCNAAINALKAGRHIVRSEPSAKVLVVNIELCSLHLQETHDLEQLLSFLIFADGCAASFLSAEPEGLEIRDFYSSVISQSEEFIQWHIGNQGFDMVLSGEVPRTIAAALPVLLPAMLNDTDKEQIRHWAVHPGGRSILDAVEQSLTLPHEALAASRRILHDYGNMSSATVMFVLKSIMDADERGEGVAMAFGPGLAAETMRFAL